MNIDYLIRWLLITDLICALFCRPYLAAGTFYPASSAFTAEVKLSIESDADGTIGPIRAHLVLDFAGVPIVIISYAAPFSCLSVFARLRCIEIRVRYHRVLMSGILAKIFKSPTISSKSKSVLMPFPFKLQGR